MLLHSDFQNGSPQLSLFHRTFLIAAGVGAAKNVERSRLWHQELQHQNPGLNTQRQKLLAKSFEAGLGAPLFLSAEKSHRLYFLFPI